MEVSNYELMVVGRLDGADSLFTKVEKLVKAANASSVSTQKMGKKVLAYPIAKQTDGEYFLFNFEAPGEAVLAISEGLRLEQEAVLRYMVVKTKETKGPKESKETKEPDVVKKVRVETKVEKEENDTKVAKAAKVTKGKKK